ncbi:MAG: hydrogenase maturation nickel metallochaperone HypA [Proteobacteria bacterium]|nr:hydrogenase maturation nickel metallochaperone HypA [Pseudomonadota bacterium]
MHEISIMMSILDTALEEARKAKAERITAVSLQIGAKSGVVVDALEFAFETTTRNTIAENSRLDIELLPFRGECVSCGHHFTCDGFLICDLCGNFGRIISGKELKIKTIEIE